MGLYQNEDPGRIRASPSARAPEAILDHLQRSPRPLWAEPVPSGVAAVQHMQIDRIVRSSGSDEVALRTRNGR